MPAARLKPGIAELLASLTGFTHVVTTAAVGAYAREVLREHGLLQHFAAVFGREDGMYPKDYGVVGRHFGIAEGDLCKQLVIVGNDEADADCRGRPIVLIYDAQMMERPSAPLRALIEDLSRTGFDGCRVPGFSFEYWGSYAVRYPVVRTILPMC